ncbi:MAG TPA: tetratricopeptide repeat protein, partial [Bacteroidota bacterium]|nr:tetratricopeptide repeat protein [Bacteroidota bacterium]
KGIAITYNNLANILCAQGDYGGAASLFRKSLDIMKEIGYREGIAGTCNNLGTIYQDQGRYREGLDLQKTALALREEIGDRPGVAMSHGNIGFLHLDLGEYGASKNELSTSVSMQEALGMKTLLSATTSWLALATARGGEVDAGLDIARKALSMAADLGQTWFEGIANRSVGVIQGMKWSEHPGGTQPETEYDEALRYLIRSLALFSDGKFEHEAARTSMEIGRLMEAAGHTREGGEYLRRAIDVFQKLGAMGDLDRALQISSPHQTEER